MSEELSFVEADISDLIHDADQSYSENLADYNPDAGIDLNTIENSELVEEQSATEKKSKEVTKADNPRSTRLPVARIKNIMKMDPDVNLVNSEAVFLVTKATELFLETLGKETYAYTATKKRKTVSKKDLDYVVNVVDCLCFLEGAMDF